MSAFALSSDWFIVLFVIGQTNRLFSDDVTAATMAYQNSETAAMLVYQENLVRIENFSPVKTSFCSKKFA